MKIPKFGTKIAFFSILNWNVKTILLYFNSEPQNLSNCKILEFENENA